MGNLWWCNLCRIIQIPQSCSVDLNALFAVNLLRLTVSAWCQRVYCLHTEEPIVNETFDICRLPSCDDSNHIWLLPTGFHHGCSSLIVHFKDLVIQWDCAFIQTCRKRLTSALLLQIDMEPFYMMTMFGRRRTNNKCWWPLCWVN